MKSRTTIALMILPLSLLIPSCGGELDSVWETEYTGVVSISPGVEPSFTIISLVPITDITVVTTLAKAVRYNEMERPTISYLKDTISPCTPVDKSSQDPCEFGTPPVVETASSEGSIPGWPLRDDMPPSFTGMLLGEVASEYYPQAVPHIVVRGTVIPNTTRCELYPLRTFPYSTSQIQGVEHYHCFANVKIKEYIVGTGPPELTVSLHRESLVGLDVDDWSNIKEDVEMNYLDDPQLRTAIAYEGRELIIFLKPPSTIAVESWTRGWLFALWFVQRMGDEIRAVASNIRYARTEEQRNRLDLPLNEFTRQVKQAAEERVTITGGRLGIDASLPLLITDANHLREHYLEAGALYNDTDRATVLPPPVPGEDDPDPGTIPTDEGTTVSSTPVPGKETTVPPSTDDAGLTVEQETTTTEATTTAPTTTETETPITTESPPTVTTTTESTETTTTTTESAPTAPVTGTTTTFPVAEPNGEEVAPATSELPREETETTTSLTPTETTATPSGDDSAPGEESASATPTDDDGAASAEDGGDSGGQPDAPPADSGTG